MGKIYRFLSFESFVNLVLTKQLTFIHPSLWEDPYEKEILYKYIREVLNQENATSAIIQYIITQRLFCSSWTRLPESDALWRIYSHNNNSVRIETDEKKTKLLENVELRDIIYVNNIDKINNDIKDFYKYISVKRTAFSHENEVRLITHYKYEGIEDAKEKYKAYLLFYGEDKKVRDSILKEIEIEDIDAVIENEFEKLGFGIEKVMISYEHINDFIESVMLNPFAEDWFCETVEIFCNKYGLNFLGKSELYTKK